MKKTEIEDIVQAVSQHSGVIYSRHPVEQGVLGLLAPQHRYVSYGAAHVILAGRNWAVLRAQRFRRTFRNQRNGKGVLRQSALSSGN
jgi:hypothetical protein